MLIFLYHLKKLFKIPNLVLRFIFLFNFCFSIYTYAYAKECNDQFNNNTDNTDNAKNLTQNKTILKRTTRNFVIRKRPFVSESDYMDYLSNLSKDYNFNTVKTSSNSLLHEFDRSNNIKQKIDPREISENIYPLISAEMPVMDVIKEALYPSNKENIINKDNQENVDNDPSFTMADIEKAQLSKKNKEKKKQDATVEATVKGILRNDRVVKTKSYFGIGGSAIAFGNVDIFGSETSTSAGPSPPIVKTFTGSMEYKPMFALSLRFGRSFPAFSGIQYPAFYRAELEIEYNRLVSTLNNIGVSPDYPTNGSAGNNYPTDPTFTLPNNLGNGHLLSINVNGYVDLIKLGPGFPYLGAGFGFGAYIFDNFIKIGFIGPVFNVFAGYIFHINNRFDLSIGYRFSMLYNMTFINNFVVPINGDTGRPVIDNLTHFDFGMIHKVEFVFWFF